jgi:hypothetical protein
MWVLVTGEARSSSWLGVVLLGSPSAPVVPHCVGVADVSPVGVEGADASVFFGRGPLGPVCGAQCARRWVLLSVRDGVSWHVWGLVTPLLVVVVT